MARNVPISTSASTTALTLGLETSASVMAEWGSLLYTLDGIIIAIFAVEVAIRIIAFGPTFFRGGWNLAVMNC